MAYRERYGIYRSEHASVGRRRTILPFSSLSAPTAVVFDAATQGNGILTFSHTCTGTNRYLIVEIAFGTGTNTMSGVTYAGQAMTLLQRTTGSFSVELWGLVNPASGANNVVCTRGVGSAGIANGATSFTNVDQTTPFKAGSGGGSSGSGITSLTGPSQTTNTGGMIVEGVASNSVTRTGSTLQGWNDGGGDGGFYMLGTGSAQNTTYTITSGNYALASAVINAVGQTGPAGTVYTDTGTPVVVLTPSTAEVHEISDAGTTPILITASAAELHEITDANTVGMVLTPSVVDIHEISDAATARVTLTPSSTTDLLEHTDATTVTLAITPSGADVYTGAAVYTDAATPVVTITPSTVEIRERTDAATVVVAMTPSTVEAVGKADVATVWIEISVGTPLMTKPGLMTRPGLMTGSQPSDTLNAVEVQTVGITITPSGTDIRSTGNTDAATVGLVITPTSITAGGVVVTDTATRTITAASNAPWGTTDSGHSWVVGSPFFAANATVMGVNGSQLTMLMPATTTNRRSQGVVGVGTDVEILAKIGMSALPAGSSFQCMVAGRLTDSSNYYESRMTFTAGGSVSLKLTARVATVETTPSGGASVTIDTGYTGAQFYWVRFNINGSTLSAKMWKDGTSEPGAWTMQATDTQLTTGSSVAFVAFGSSGTSADDTFLIDEFDAAQLNVIGGADILAAVDTATVGVAITPSSAELHTITDAATAPLVITPSTVDIYATAGDAATAAVVVTPSSVDVAAYVDANTVSYTVTPSSTDVAATTEAATVGMVLTVTAAEGAVFSDAATNVVVITPTALDVVPNSDSATAPVVLTPSTVETAQFVDAVTVLVDVDPTASTEQRISTDSATVPIAFTPSAVEGAQFADAANVLVLLTPSTVEAAQFADAVSVGVSLTPTSTDTALVVESATIPITLTPSAAEVYGRVLTDTGTVPFTLGASAQESAQRADASTVPVLFTTSATEVQIVGTFETATVPIALVPSGLDTLDTLEAATVPLKMTVTGTDTPERAYLDPNTIPITITPIITFEDIFKTDGGIGFVGITPFALSEFQGDGDIVPVKITSAIVEVFVHEDTNVILIDIAGDGVESASLTTPADVYFRITPSIAEVFAGIDQATILVSITPGVIFEVQQVADYLLVGVLSHKWAAVLRDNVYVGTLFETRYVVTDFDNRWHYHYRGRGDE